ncbi:MAG: hypothetical protein JSV49_02505 [Thermoplasmata archaeon]|nr:MAG: hypothetical protein JSV49_02505 [Thermoplasmata archaeon]
MMRSAKKPRNISIFYIVSIVLISSFFCLVANVSASEPVSAQFIPDKFNDKRELNPETGEPELVLDVVIDTNTAGKYLVFGDMSPSTIKNTAITSTYLNVGENTVKLQFPGERIYRSQIDGRYSILLTVEFEGGEITDLTYLTQKSYDYTDFEGAGKSTTDFTLGLVSNTVQLQTDVFTAVIHEYQPVIEYYYSGDDGNTAKFKVTYTTLIGYSDIDGDGMYSPIDDEPVYTADLEDVNWNSNKVLFENFESFDFEITAAVTLYSNQYQNVDAVIGFHYSSASYTTNSQRKFDIDIQLSEDTHLEGVDAIALKQIITDESSVPHNLVFDSSSHMVRYMNDESLQHGYYEWAPKALTNTEDGDVDVSASTVEFEDGLILYLSYDYDESIVWYYHDPIIGVDPANLQKGIIETAEELLHHPGLYIISSLVAAVVVYGSLRKEKKKSE